MTLFANMGETPASGSRGSFLTEGNFVLEVQRVKLIESKKNSNTYFVLESKVENSSTDSHYSGQLVTWLVKMGGDWPEYALADIKAFIVAASGAPESEVDEAFMEEVLAGDGDLLAGKKVNCTVVVIETKRGGTFNKHSFSSHFDN